jgi:hypothetical protein
MAQTQDVVTRFVRRRVYAIMRVESAPTSMGRPGPVMPINRARQAAAKPLGAAAMEAEAPQRYEGSCVDTVG